MMRSAHVSIGDVVAGDLCSGCGACAVTREAAAAMRLSADGFYRPTSGPPNLLEQSADPICPGLSLHHRARSAEYAPLWGPVVRTVTGHSSDPNIRFMGSSGGVLTAIAVALLESGRVAFVWHTRADPNDPIGNVSGPSRTRDEVIEAAGSRYGPSSPLAGLEEALATGETFAFIGKPCDVAALSKMAQVDPRIDRQISYRLSFFCAGVPGRRGTEAVIRALDTSLDDVQRFRYRGEGWPGLARVTRHDGTSSTMDYNASWGTILNRHLQFRCKICPDGTGEFADIACADAWYGKGGYPDFQEREGRSLIVTRTAAGDALVRTLEEEGRLAVSPLAIGEIEAMQPYQASRKRNVSARRLALIVAGRPAPKFTGFGFAPLVVRHSWFEQVRSFLGTLRRVMIKKRSY